MKLIEILDNVGLAVLLLVVVVAAIDQMEFINISKYLVHSFMNKIFN